MLLVQVLNDLRHIDFELILAIAIMNDLLKDFRDGFSNLDRHLSIGLSLGPIAFLHLLKSRKNKLMGSKRSLFRVSAYLLLSLSKFKIEKQL